MLATYQASFFPFLEISPTKKFLPWDDEKSSASAQRKAHTQEKISVKATKL